MTKDPATDGRLVFEGALTMRTVESVRGTLLAAIAAPLGDRLSEMTETSTPGDKDTAVREQIAQDIARAQMASRPGGGGIPRRMF